MKKMLFWGTICVLLTFSGTLVLANPAPYVPKKGNASFKQIFSDIEKMPVNATARQEFFKESERNLGLTETQLKEKIKAGQVRAEMCGKNCELKTAGLQDNTSVYWRTVKENEQVVYVFVKEDWKPWFLVRCGNPVKDSKPPTAPPVTTYQKKDCCWQTGSPIVLESALINGGTVSVTNHLAIGTSPAPRFVSIFYPIACSGESFNEKQ
jgi:hypothetical protein